MSTISRLTRGSIDLATLQTIVQQQEGIYGPLSGLAVQGTDIEMIFDIDVSPDPAFRAVLMTYSGVDVPVLPGLTLLTANLLPLDGALTYVAVYRRVP